MNLTIVSLSSFSKDIKMLHKRYKSISKDLQELKSILLQNPKTGTILGKNCYKLRVATLSISTGKSGGFRVIYYYYDGKENIYLVSIYSKVELEIISDEKLTEILKINGLYPKNSTS